MRILCCWRMINEGCVSMEFKKQLYTHKRKESVKWTMNGMHRALTVNAKIDKGMINVTCSSRRKRYTPIRTSMRAASDNDEGLRFQAQSLTKLNSQQNVRIALTCMQNVSADRCHDKSKFRSSLYRCRTRIRTILRFFLVWNFTRCVPTVRDLGLRWIRTEACVRKLTTIEIPNEINNTI